MYRIMLSVNGYYYVQVEGRNGWKKIGDFHSNKRDAAQLAKDLNKCYGRDIPFDGKLVCYC